MPRRGAVRAATGGIAEEIAAGSAYEVTAGLRIAVAKRYITWAEMDEVDVVLDRVRAMLYRLTKRR